MAKRSNGNSAGDTSQPTVHFFLRKGGIGKSEVASWPAELLMDRGQLVRWIDADPVNGSLRQHKAFTVEKLDLVNQDRVLQRMRYDPIIERFATDDAVVNQSGVKPASDSGEHEMVTVTFERLLNSEEAAAFLNIHPKTLQKMPREGTVPRAPWTISAQRTSRRNPPATNARESLIPMVLLPGCRVRFSTCRTVPGRAHEQQ